MSDGRVLIDIDLDKNDLDKELDKLEGDVGKSANRISASVNKLSDQSVEYAKRATLGIAAVTGAIMGMSIKAAGDMQAMTAQFEQVFTGSDGSSLVSQAEEAVDKIVKDTGILPNRLKQTFTQIAAFAKTSGMETADALALTERATIAAADGAAFYDKSIEEVSESLQSFLKGNYENDAALGISATETTRNAKANELYAVSFNELDESQKQLTLLAMVEDGNKLSGAMGQAARESDGLENVLGNMKRVVTDVAAAFGAPLLAPFVAGAKAATAVLSNFANLLTENPALVYAIVGALGTLAAAFGAVWLAAKKVEIMGEVSKILGAMTNPIFLIIAAIGALVTAFVYLWQTNEDFRNKVTEIWNNIKSFMLPIIESIKNFLVDTWTNLLSWWNTNQESMKNTVINVWNAVSAFIMPIIQAVANFIRTIWETVAAWWSANQNNIKATVSTVWNAIQSIFGSVITLIVGVVKFGLDQIQQFWDKWGTVIATVVQVAWAFISSVFSGNLKNILAIVSSVINQVQNIFQFAMDFIKNLVNTVLAFMRGDWDGVLNGIKGIVGAFKDYISNTFENMMNTAKTFVQNGIDAITGFFDRLWDIDLAAAGQAIIDGFLGGLRSAYENVKDFVSGIAGWIAENKGPISYDRTLLIDHGNVIMEGLNKGLTDRFKDVQRTITSMAEQMQLGFEINTRIADIPDLQRSISYMPNMSPEYALAGAGRMQSTPSSSINQVFKGEKINMERVEHLLEVIASKEFATYLDPDEVAQKTYKRSSQLMKKDSDKQARGSGVW